MKKDYVELFFFLLREFRTIESHIYPVAVDGKVSALFVHIPQTYVWPGI